MNFEHPFALLFLVLPLLWAAWEWRQSSRHLGVLLKAGSFAAIIVAFSQPVLTVWESKVAVAVLADTSASVSNADLTAESHFADRVDSARGRHWSKVIPFARSTRDSALDEHGKNGWGLRHTAGAGGRGTNLEAAIRDGAASLPGGMVPRLVLISDGMENSGSAARAIWQAQQLGIPIDTVALPGRPKPSLSVDSVTMPGQVFSGERFPIEITVISPSSAQATVDITAEGKSIGKGNVQLGPGENHLRMQATVNSTGAVAIAGKVAAGSLGEARFEDAVTLRRPRALLVSNDPPDSQQHIDRVLQANQFELVAATGIPDKLDDYQLVIINNWDAESIPDTQKSEIENYVKQGGGLAWIAGEHNVYVDKKDAPENALERTLPAKLAPPRSQEGTAVVIIIDKSSSMEGRKIELARLAAIGVVENLRPIDTVGVLIFDNSFQWAVSVRKAEDKNAIKRLISGITPDGGTQIAPALTEAYQKILPVNAVYKHIVLLTDGISEEGDSMTLTKEAVTNRVTISTVGLGQDVNRAFLEKVASAAEGKSYFLNEPAGLEQLLLHDVQEHTGATAVEKNIQAKAPAPAEVLDGVDIAAAPPLHGYIRYTARPTSDTILIAADNDPLLSRWQYGLGRAVVWTSDAKNRWAENWVTWPGFDRLWANIFRDLLPHAKQSETVAEFDRASNDLVVDYRLARNTEEPAKIPDIFVFGPDGLQAPLKVTKAAAGHYRGKLNIGQHQGLFRIRPEAESKAFPEVGFYRQEEEMVEYGNNTALLQQIAAATGGHFNPSPNNVFDSNGRSLQSFLQLWPGLLALAILLNLAELVVRKWAGIAETLHLSHEDSVAA